MVKKERETHQRRTIFIAGVVMVAFVGLAAQLGNLTIMQQDQYRSVAEQQHTRDLPIFAPRGVIYDRNMEQLVSNRPANSVFIRYPYYKRPEILQRLAVILNVPLTEIQKEVTTKMAAERYYEPIRLKDDITTAQYTLIVERKNELPGVEVQAQAVRVYPNKDLAAHLLGYVNEISADELQKLKPNGYVGGELIGRTGLESFYENQLRGKPGVKQVVINNSSQPLGESQPVNPEPGNSLVLTIDLNLQKVAQRALEWDMWRIRNTIIGDGPWPNAKAGAVVVMDVKTGAVLAMVSSPAFDPNLFATGISQKDLDRLQDPVLTPEVNRALQSSYQPGSTWKMMTSAAALENNVIGPYDKIFCGGVYDKAGNPKDWIPYGHGWVNTVAALQGSCDIYYYEMGYRLGIDRLVSTAKEFGFGSKTGIDIGGEVSGLLPDAQNRDKYWSAKTNDPWSVGHTVSAAIGQIVQVTPLQLVRYASTLANQGKLMKPYIVQKIVDANGKLVKDFAPQQVGAVTLKPEYLRTILDCMTAVNQPGGGSDFSIYPLPGGIKTGGKTGTAQYPPWDDYGFFVGLAPMDDPQIAIAVVIEQAGHGGSISSVARTIMASYFKQELPDYDPAKVPAEFPNDLNGLRKKYQVVGSGQ
jgi:penicillin-binding protein 2